MNNEFCTAHPFLIVTLDGGAAAGKSSTARALATRFNFLHVDTGMHYRALAHCLIQANISYENIEAIESFLKYTQFGTVVQGNSAFVCVNAEILEAPTLRSEKVNALVSYYAAIPLVRRFLLNYQRGEAEVARAQGFSGLIIEGRDMGSVVFPDAPLRFFLYADIGTRQIRRAKDSEERDDVQKRDTIDSSRTIAPLTCPKGAISIDSTTLSLEDVVGMITQKIEAFCPDLS